MVIDGRTAGAQIRKALRPYVSLLESHKRYPQLTVVQVGSDPASEVYIRQKALASAALGIEFRHLHLSEGCRFEEVASLLKDSDSPPGGLILQTPLPPHLNTFDLLSLISPSRDVDGLTPVNQGYVLLNQLTKGLLPCTPLGIILLLRTVLPDLRGRRLLVIGRSFLVGKPTALLATSLGATVTIAHSGTKNLSSLCQAAEVIISATGQPGLLQSKDLSSGTIVIDVGITRSEKNGLQGDVDQAVYTRDDLYISPVPGGVGPMTVACLLANTIAASAFGLDLPLPKGLELQQFL